MTITQTIQSTPAKANELFAKLAETTTGAVKTRERLFADLKAELELHARLEEEHLFPVLRKHKETKGLVSDALNDNKQARALMAELEQMPKEGDEFINKLAELKKAFQQHVRDEKKELLPAVKEALSKEEAQAVAEKIEAEKAGVEEAKRAEAEQHRAEARREREEEERRQAEAEARQRRARDAKEAVARSAGTVINMARGNAETVQETVRSGVDVTAETAARSMDQFARLFGFSGDRVHQAAVASSRNVDAVMESSTMMARGFQNMSREYVNLGQDQLKLNLETLNAILRSRTPQDLLAAQSNWMRQSMDILMSSSRRMLSMTTAEGNANVDNERRPAA